MSVPAELKKVRAWLNWCIEQNGDRPTKVPIVAQSKRRRADVTDSKLWKSYNTAVRFAKLEGREGIGFALSASDPYIVIDLDRCVDEDDEIHSAAAEIIEGCDSYAAWRTAPAPARTASSGTAQPRPQASAPAQGPRLV